jgi:hypothetical protein
MMGLHPARRQAGIYGAALLLVATGFCARLALTPVFHASHTYTVFYPVVIVAAYFLGARPAILTAVLSGLLAYWCFDQPEFQLKADVVSLTSVFFFALTTSVSIYFITGMARALTDLAQARGRAEDLARSHAGLFQDLNERVTNHLQLVAALLQVQARDERDGALSRALAEASARTLLISRAHRSLGGEGMETLDFDAFARQLLDATLSARGNRMVQVEIDKQGIRLPLDQATSVAIVLLECLNARLQLNTPAALRVRLRGDDRETTLEVSEVYDEPGVHTAIDLQRYPIDAMVEQLGGRFSFRSDAEGAVSALVFPRPGVPVAAGAEIPLSRTLH